MIGIPGLSISSLMATVACRGGRRVSAGSVTSRAIGPGMSVGQRKPIRMRIDDSSPGFGGDPMTLIAAYREARQNMIRFICGFIFAEMAGRALRADSSVAVGRMTHPAFCLSMSSQQGKASRGMVFIHAIPIRPAVCGMAGLAGMCKLPAVNVAMTTTALILGIREFSRRMTRHASGLNVATGQRE